MARRRHTPEQIIRKLREADRMLGEGKELAEVVRHLEVTESTYHRWRNQFGGMKADDASPAGRKSDDGDAKRATDASRAETTFLKGEGGFSTR